MSNTRSLPSLLHFNKTFGIFSDGEELEELAGLLALEELAGLLALEELAGLLALEELAGLLALEELAGLLTLEELEGLLALEELSGVLALEELAGLLALDELAGLLALEELAGVLALEELAGVLSLEELSGSVDDVLPALADEAEAVDAALSEETLELSGAGSGSADDTVLWLSGWLDIEIFSRTFSRYEHPLITTMLAASIAAS